MSLWSRTTGPGWLSQSDDCDAAVPVAAGTVGGVVAWPGGQELCTGASSITNANNNDIGLCPYDEHVAFTRGDTNNVSASSGYCGVFGAVPPSAAMAAHGGVNVARGRRCLMRLFRLLSACLLVIIVWVMLRDWMRYDWIRSVDETDTWRGVSDSHSPKKVKLAVYYEARCPDSEDFIVNQLVSTVKKVPDIIDLVLVPYGKAEMINEEGKIHFKCQHGPEECYGNKLHACAIKMATSRQQTIQFVACLIRGFYRPKRYAASCAKRSNLDADRILACADSPDTDAIIESYARMTESLQPQLTFVPTITLDGSQDNQLQLRKNLLSSLCVHYQKNFNSTPDGCK